MYPLFEAIKLVEGNHVNLEYHQARIENACEQFFQSPCLFSLIEIVKCPEAFDNKLVKCRFRYNASDYVIQFCEYKYQHASNFKLVECSNLDYSFKYTDRSLLNNLVEDAEQFDDIILVKNGLITDSSYANLVFEKDGDLFTPEFPLLHGTKRQYYLDKGILQLANISLQNIDNYNKITRINAMIDLENAEWVSIDKVDMSNFI